MKFCPKCGLQLADEATFCPRCGTILQPQGYNAPMYQQPPQFNAPYGNIPANPQPQPQPQTQAPAKKSSALAIFNFLFNIFSLIYGVFIVLAAALPEVYVSAHLNTSSYYYGNYISAYGYYNFNPLYTYIALTCSIIMFVFGIFCLTMGVKEREDTHKKLSGVFRFIAGIVILILSIILCIISS